MSEVVVSSCNPTSRDAMHVVEVIEIAMRQPRRNRRIEAGFVQEGRPLLPLRQLLEPVCGRPACLFLLSGDQDMFR
jgi:hypothetical protein